MRWILSCVTHYIGYHILLISILCRISGVIVSIWYLRISLFVSTNYLFVTCGCFEFDYNSSNNLNAVWFQLHTNLKIAAMDKTILDLLTYENPVLRSFAFWTAMLVIKMLLMSILTGVQRFRTKVSTRLWMTNKYSRPPIHTNNI